MSWIESELNFYDKDRLEKIGVKDDWIEFLNKVGLPKDAAPFLSFESEANLFSLAEIFDLPNSNFDSLIQIGFDGEGSPICIDLSVEQIVLCDHEFEFNTQYMNCSPQSLNEYLKSYNHFIIQLTSNKGEDAFLDCNFTDEEFDELYAKLLEIEHKALEPETFWNIQLEQMNSDRSYYRQSN